MLNHNPPLSLTLCGSFGFGNAGDEAIPLAIADLAKILHLDVDIQVLGRFEQPALSSVIGLGKQDRQQRERLRGNLLLVAGGGVIEANPSCVLLRCAPYLRKSFAPTLALYAANVDAGIRYPWQNRWQLANLLRTFDRLYVRDVASADMLRLLLPARNIEVIGDSVLWMEPAAEIPPELAASGTYIAVTLASNVSWQEPAWYEWLANQLSELAVQLKAAIAFIPFSILYSNDLQEHRRVAGRIRQLKPSLDIINWEQSLTPRELSAILGHSLLTISMRLHGCVMAYARQVPFVGLAYHPKVTGFAHTVGWERFCLPSVLPNFQSPKVYGYSFAATGLVNSDLVKTALMALDYNSFEKLELFKRSLAEAFLELYQLHAQSL